MSFQRLKVSPPLRNLIGSSATSAQPKLVWHLQCAAQIGLIRENVNLDGLLPLCLIKFNLNRAPFMNCIILYVCIITPYCRKKLFILRKKASKFTVLKKKIVSIFRETAKIIEMFHNDVLSCEETRN